MRGREITGLGRLTTDCDYQHTRAMIEIEETKYIQRRYTDANKTERERERERITAYK